MTVNNYLFALCLLCLPAAYANCPHQGPEQMARESSALLNDLFERERAHTNALTRNLAIVSVALAAEGKLDARALQVLSQHVDTKPNDLFAKLYEGYAWVFSAGEYHRRKNYLRAAEDIKRGFFLIDEAVDSEPDNWRLRYLRLRMDAFVPADLGRYVIALKDAAILSGQLEQLPPQLHPLLALLHTAALERSQSAPALSNPCGLQNMVTVDEIKHLLNHALEQAP